MDSERDIPGDNNEHEDDTEELKNHVIFVCERRQLKILAAIGVVLVLVVVTVGGVLGARASSSSSSSNAASSRDGNSGGAVPTSSSVPNMTAPLAVLVAASPTNAPTLSPPSPSTPAMPPSASVATPAPIQNSGPIPTSSPTRMPVVSSPAEASSTMQSIRNSGVLRCGVYDVTLSGDNNDIGFSIDLVRGIFCELVFSVGV
jgi:hypothetical protein